MLSQLRSCSWAALLFCSAALAEQSADEDVHNPPSRNFTYDTTTSGAGTAPTSLSSLTGSLWPLTSSPPWSETLPYTLTIVTPSTSSTFSTTSHGVSSSDVDWGPITPPPPITASDATTTPLTDTSLPDATPSDSTFLPSIPSSTITPISTPMWSNSSTNSSFSSMITSLPVLISSEPACVQGRKGCDSNTNTVKTEIPPKSTRPCRGKGCNPNKNTGKPKIPDSPTSAAATTCDTTLSDGELPTIWVVEPNTSTITLTVTANRSTSFSTTPEFTPPVYCTVTPNIISFDGHANSTSSGVTFAITTPQSNGAWLPVSAKVPTTIYITSKNPVTVMTTETPPYFPGGPKTGKATVTPSSTDADWGPLTPPPPQTASDATTTPLVDNGGGTQPDQTGQVLPPPTTAKISGVSVVVGPTQVIIGSSTIKPGSSTTIVTQGGQTFTIGPSQVIGPGTTINIPTLPGAVFIPTPTPTVIAGVPVQIGASQAIIGGTTFSIGAGAPQETIVVDGQTISVGPGGLGFAQTTVAPPLPTPLPTKVVIIDGEVISAVGSSVAVIGGVTFTYGPEVAIQTDVFNDETITIGPSGINFGSTVIGGSANPSGTQIGLAGGLTVTEMGASIAVIEGTTFIIGPNGTPTTEVVDGSTIIAGSDGLTLGGTTLSYPFGGYDITTSQVITVGGLTISEIGSTLVDIGGTILTIGPGAQPTTEVYNGQTISVGPDGIGFKTTTLTAESGPMPTTSAKQTGKKKNGVGALKPFHGVLGICIAVGVGYNI